MSPMQIYGMVLVSVFWLLAFVGILASIFLNDDDQKAFAAGVGIFVGLVALFGTAILAASFKG